MEPNVRAPIAFALRFPNSAESKYSPSELELLASVWACERFRTYLLGKSNVILKDHKTIIYALNEILIIKTFSVGGSPHSVPLPG